MNSQKQGPAVPGGTIAGAPVTGAEVFDIPPGMSPAEAVRRFGGGARVRLPDGGLATLPTAPGAIPVPTTTFRRPEAQ